MSVITESFCIMEEDMVFFPQYFYHYLGCLYEFGSLLWFCFLNNTCSHNQTLSCPIALDFAYFRKLILLQNQVVDIADCLHKTKASDYNNFTFSIRIKKVSSIDPLQLLWQLLEFLAVLNPCNSKD